MISDDSPPAKSPPIPPSSLAELGPNWAPDRRQEHEEMPELGTPNRTGRSWDKFKNFLPGSSQFLNYDQMYMWMYIYLYIYVCVWLKIMIVQPFGSVTPNFVLDPSLICTGKSSKIQGDHCSCCVTSPRRFQLDRNSCSCYLNFQ